MHPHCNRSLHFGCITKQDLFCQCVRPASIIAPNCRFMPKKPPPTDHPAPYQSKLREHEELIRSLVRKQLTWTEIAEQLQRDHGLKIAPKTIYSFFKRQSRPRPKNHPIRLRQGRPMQPSTAAEPATPPEQQAISYDESVERARARIKQENETNKRTDDDWDLVDPTKPL